MRRISSAARQTIQKEERLQCYTFDELVDQRVNFDKYFAWLEAEVKSKGIERYYIDLACTKDDIDPNTGERLGTSHYDRVDDYISQWLDDPSAEHISILGEYGTGKTWFCLHYAFQAMQAYKAAKDAGRQRPRLPILIQLRDFIRAMKVETLFSDFFFRKFEIGLPGYSAYEQLNRMGKLLLVFDGFDEMADRTNRQKQIDNFWELARTVSPGSKAILTCRAEHFEFAKAAVKTFGGEETPTDSPNPIILLEPPRFEIITFEKLSPQQITEIIIRREGKTRGRELARRILEIPESADLAKRAGSIEFIIAALPSLDQNAKIDLSRVFLHATRELLLKNIRENRSFTSMADKVHFLCELAWQMLSTGELKVNFTQFPDRVRRYRPELKTRETDHWKFDVAGQSLLVRDDDGNYFFSHKSLPEFFVAYKFAAELGLFASNSEWTNSYFPQERDIEKLPSRHWHDFFLCPNEQHVCGNYANTIDESPRCKAPGGACIRFFEAESLERLRTTFGRQMLTPEVLAFLSAMTEEAEKLWIVINNTKGKIFDQVGYCGGNAATILNRLRQRFSDRNLNDVVISGADLTNTDLTKVNLRGANLEGAVLSHSKLDGADLRNADLTKVSFQEIAPIVSIAWSPDNQRLATVGSDRRLRLWSTTDWGSSRRVSSLADINHVCWDSSGRNLYASCDDGICMIRIDKHDEVDRIHIEGRTTKIVIDPHDRFLAIKNSVSYREAISLGWTKNYGYHRPSYNNIYLWDLQKTVKIRLLSVRGALIYPTILRFSPNESILFVGRYNGNLQAFNTKGDKVGAKRVFSRTGITALAVSPDGFVMCGSNKGQIRFFNYKREQKTFVPTTPVLPFGYTDLNSRTINTSDDWKPTDFGPASRDTGKILQIESNLKTGDFAILDGTGELGIWNKQGLKRLELASKTDRWSLMTFNPAGNLLAVCAQSTIHIFDVDPNSTTFGKDIRKIGQTVSCVGTLFSGAKGLGARAPSGKGTLGQWLQERGAISRRSK